MLQLLLLLTRFLVTISRASSFDNKAYHEYLIEHIIPTIQTDVSLYPIAIVPDDLWLVIGKHSDSVSVWNLSIVCKRIGALFRSSRGFESFAEHFSKADFTEILLQSDRRLESSMQSLLGKNSLLESRYGKHLTALGAGTEENIVIMIVHKIILRVSSLFLLHYLMADVAFLNTVPLKRFLANVAEDLHGLYSPSNELQELFYLPKPQEKKLFDREHPFLIGCIAYSAPKFLGYTFVPVIIVDYILPAWRKELILSEREKYILKHLLRGMEPFYFQYFKHILWALGDLDMFGFGLPAPDYAKQLTEFLGDIGLNFEKFKLIHREIKGFRGPFNNMIFILTVAMQWKLPYLTIAQFCSGNSLCKRVALGDIPEEISELRDITYQNICTLLLDGNRSNFKPVKLINGKFVAENQQEPEKRKADDDLVNDQNAEKRRRLHEAK